MTRALGRHIIDHPSDLRSTGMAPNSQCRRTTRSREWAKRSAYRYPWGPIDFHGEIAKQRLPWTKVEEEFPGATVEGYP